MRPGPHLLLLVGTAIASLTGAVIGAIALHERAPGSGGLVGYQQAKLTTEAPAVILFFGDSSLGNALDAAYFSKESGKRTINLATTEALGFGADLALFHQASRRHAPRLVVFMHTMLALQRPASHLGLLAAGRDVATFAALPAASLREAANEALGLVRGSGKLLRADLMPRAEFTSDYVKQRERTDSLYVPTLERDDAHPGKGVYLRALASHCRTLGTKCVYMFGPVPAPLYEATARYRSAARSLVEASGIPVLDAVLALPPEAIGDDYDHVHPSHKTAVTRRILEALKGSEFMSP